VVTGATSQYLGWKLSLRNLRMEGLLLLLMLGASALGWWFVHHLPWVAGQHPFVRLLLLGLLEVAVFAPLGHRLVLPMLRRSVS
jgi:hypothetical protein